MVRSFRSNRAGGGCLVLGLGLLILAGCASTQEGRVTKLRARAAHETALAELAEGRVSSGLASLKEAVSLTPDDPVYRNSLGLVYLEMRNFPEAMAAFTKAIELDPGYAEAYHNLGVALAQSDRYEEAIDEYKKALSLPVYATPDVAYYNLGLAYFHTGRLEEAEEAIRRALKLEPGRVAAHFQLGVILFKTGRHEAARAVFRQARDLGPGTPSGQAAGEYLKRLGEGG
ncbi:MAG: tetratricopeptide repeat protein [Candidatus Tectimicrobiota bacterium]